MKNTILSAFFVAILMHSGFSMAQSELVDRFSDAELVQLLKNEGYGAVTQVKDGVIKIKINGRNFFLINKDDGDLQAYYAISGVQVSYENMNEWNRTKRLSRAYLDEENDPVLESDLLANGGLTEKHVAEFFRVFTGSTQRFRGFLLERDAS